MSNAKESKKKVVSKTQSYTDDKGRKRWHRNDDVALIVKQLGEYLIIGGYPEDHAKRYAQLAHTISRMPEQIDRLSENKQLNSIAGVGGTIRGTATIRDKSDTYLGQVSDFIKL
jgi:hypothetical protein